MRSRIFNSFKMNIYYDINLNGQGTSFATMARRALKLVSLVSGAGAIAGLYMHSNKHLDPNDFGVVRVGRAVATTAVITFDYITSLRNFPRGTEEYDYVKSQINELFASFEDVPLGAASLAQVHKAVLQDGRTVAVKVQHPKVQAQSSKDILLMEILVLVVKQIFPDFEFMWLVDEAKKNLPLELDFLNEGKNAEKVAYMLRCFDFLKVPKIYWELSTRRVLFMEFMEGGQVNDKDYMDRNCINVSEISRNLGKIYSEMIFVNGFVHCDPHPGNVLVRKCPTTGKSHIILLDHGLYQVLTDSFRLDYCRLWQALIKADVKQIKQYSQRLGAGDLYPLFACMLTARSWESVNRGIDRLPVTSKEDVEIRTNAATYLPQITKLLSNVPRQMLLLLKTNDLLRGIESSLQTRANASSFLNMSRCCIRAVAVYQRSKSNSLFRKAQISLSEALSLWQINLHELFLWLKVSQLGKWVIAFLKWMHYSK
ncbi:aarF domain-containing protein kinase 1 isoform X3 [Crotalus tigris]|uniref:aarF domain-containing protein kinase 1 isoform X3 n=1 Tax=Crotalus tigris TaxID=88082 RepID=UPI00192F774C|nr:aarF domain-containing protein kinase 1 isoform X3 [Crotalus tigris]